MTSVEINAGGRYVKVEQEGRDVETLLPLAERAWKATEGAKHPTEGSSPGYGFQVERANSSTLPTSPGGYGFERFEEVRA